MVVVNDTQIIDVVVMLICIPKEPLKSILVILGIDPHTASGAGVFLQSSEIKSFALLQEGD